MRKVIVTESVILLLCIARLFIPVSVGLIDNNLFFYFVKGVGMNFVLVCMVMLTLLLGIHAIGFRQKREMSDIKTDIICIVFTLVSLLVSIF